MKSRHILIGFAALCLTTFIACQENNSETVSSDNLKTETEAEKIYSATKLSSELSAIQKTEANSDANFISR